LRLQPERRSPCHGAAAQLIYWRTMRNRGGKRGRKGTARSSPPLKLWLSADVNERRCRGRIAAAQRWKTMLLHSDSRRAGCGLGEARGLRAELLLQLAVVEVPWSAGNVAVQRARHGSGVLCS